MSFRFIHVVTNGRKKKKILLLWSWIIFIYSIYRIEIHMHICICLHTYISIYAYIYVYIHFNHIHVCVCVKVLVTQSCPILLFYFSLFFNFTILYLFCHISKWIRHRYTCVPHPEPSSLLPPHTIPLGRPSAPAPSIQYCALNLDWQLVSYMILHMFQCHSPKSSHHRVHRVQKTILYISVSFAVSYTGLLLPSF